MDSVRSRKKQKKKQKKQTKNNNKKHIHTREFNTSAVQVIE